MQTLRALWLGLPLAWLPLAAPALSPEDLRHLTERVGFAATPQQQRELAALDRMQAVSHLLRQADQGCDAATLPAWAEQKTQSPVADNEAAQLAYRKLRHGHRVELQNWWLEGMLTSPAPLCDRMALFWHQYFPIPVSQTRSEGAALRQVQRFRQQWAGDFREHLRLVSREAPMLEFLGLQHSHKRQPSENYARELLELYTLGPGHYTEVDVREAARAFTGWRRLRRLDVFVKWWPAHDLGEKTFLGETGRFDGDDIIDIVLRQPRTAEYVVEKLWREFVSPTPDPTEVQRLAAKLRNHWSIRTVLKDLLRSPAFWAAEHRNSLVKSPVELVIGTLRAAGVQQLKGNALAAWTTAMGQGLYQPPDVKGWRGQEHWITAQTLQARQIFLLGLAEGFSEETISALVEQVPEFPGFDAQRLQKDSRLLHEAMPQALRSKLSQDAQQLAYQLK